MMATHLLDPNWPTAAQWIAGNYPGATIGTVGIMAAPLCKGSITPGRCDLAPSAIRSMLGRFSTLDASNEGDLRELAVKEFSDLDIANFSPTEAANIVTSAVCAAISSVDALMILGGDNSITRPAFHGLGGPISRRALLTLDAHLDLRDLESGPNNGNPVRGLLADGLPGANIAQIGIQSFANSPNYMNVARKAGIWIVNAEQVQARGISSAVQECLTHLSQRADKIYVDFDIDVLDRAFAPACPGSRPGGLAPYELFCAARLCGENPKVVAVDLVEVDPTKDLADLTAMSATKCLLSFVAGVRTRFVNGAS